MEHVDKGGFPEVLKTAVGIVLLLQSDLIHLIRSAGYEPVLRDTTNQTNEMKAPMKCMKEDRGYIKALAKKFAFLPRGKRGAGNNLASETGRLSQKTGSAESP